MEILIKKSHLFSSKKRNYKRLSFLLQLRVSSFKIIREKESRENLPTSFSYLRRRLPNICDWGLLVLLIFWSESWFSASSVLFLYPKTFDSPEASARSSFSAPRSVLTETWQCEKKIWAKQIYKKRQKNVYNRPLTIMLFNCQTRKFQTFTVRNVLNMARYIFHFNPIHANSTVG